MRAARAFGFCFELCGHQCDQIIGCHRERSDIAGLFEALESSKHSLGIEAYSLAQATSLERVFIEMAKQQLHESPE